MAPEHARFVRRVTFLMVGISSLAVEIAAVDTRPVGQSLALAGLWLAFAFAAARFVPLPEDPHQKPPFILLAIFMLLGVAPFVVEPLRRDWTGDGYPLELQMVFGLRNIGFGLAACAGWLLCLRMASIVSLFLTLFSAAMTNHPMVMVLLGVYTAVGSAWLMLCHWSGLKTVLISSEHAVTLEVQPERERIPWLALTALLLAMGGGILLVVIGPGRGVYSLGELVPTSGGTGATDPFARYGIGDGPEETAGDNANAAGMVETDRMIEDNKNSLIDAVSDMYGPPHKPSQEQERMVAAGQVDVIEYHGKVPDNRRPSRDFDTSRQGPKGNRTPESRKARGLFEVEGRTPLHVRVVAYDRYDAAEARWLAAAKPSNKLLEPTGRDWMHIGNLRDVDWYLAKDEHRLKTAALTDNLVPTPSLLTDFRINKVDRPDYYDWDYEGVLALAGRKRTPPGIVVTTQCHTLDPERLPASAFAGLHQPSGAAPHLTDIPESLEPSVRHLAQAWAGDQPRGWPQIKAILTRLRSDYRLNTEISAPEQHPAPVLWFLEESQQGPDYLFASAAALLLRSLNYPTRVCLGYYASPLGYDPETAHTPVRRNDLHFWAEIRLHDGHWMVLEPTPGYEVLAPRLPWREQLYLAFWQVAHWVGDHAVLFAALGAVVTLGWFRRRECRDRLAIWIWSWRPGANWHEQVTRTIRLLERRGRWNNLPRPASSTAWRWLQEIHDQFPERDPDLQHLTAMAQWATYATEIPPPWPENDVLQVCRSVLERWSLRRWRDIHQQIPVTGE